MADLSITAASVAPSTGATTVSGTAGETITAGMSVYLNAAAPPRWMKAQCDGTDLQSGYGSQGVGIARHGSLDGQPITVQTGGKITIGATVAQGTMYGISATAGGICPMADLTTGNYVTPLGLATSTTVLDMAFARASGTTSA